MQVDFAAKELTLKLVYYGPALGGKTTNLRAIHWLSASKACGDLMTLETKNDRTLFFDVLPIAIGADDGLRIRFKLFTVPGQVMHNATRRLVLQAADGIAFIADSQRSEAEANRESFLNLEQNLQDNGIDPSRIPMVIQFNKRDLIDVQSDDELDALATRSREPIYKAIATRGYGVMQTLRGLMERTWNTLERDHELEDKLGISPAQFMREIDAKLKNDLGRRAP